MNIQGSLCEWQHRTPSMIRTGMELITGMQSLFERSDWESDKLAAKP